MAFIVCPECNRPVNEQMSNCMHCGLPLAIKHANRVPPEPAHKFLATTPMRVPQRNRESVPFEPAAQFAATTPLRVTKPAADAVSHEPTAQFMATVPIQRNAGTGSDAPADVFIATTPMRVEKRIEGASGVPVPLKEAASKAEQATRSPAARLMQRLLKRDEEA